MTRPSPRSHNRAPNHHSGTPARDWTPFRRGWAASTRHPLELHDVVRTWDSFTVGKLTVRAHSALGGSRATDGECVVLLLGEPVDIASRTTNRVSIAKNVAATLSSRGASAATREIAYLGGRFVAFMRKREMVYIITDMAATIPAFWTERGGGLTLASYAALASEIAGNPVDDSGPEILRAAREEGVTRTLYLPGARTPYLGVTPVLANHLLRLDTRTASVSHRRFYPFDDTDPIRDPRAAYDAFSWAFHEHCRLLSEFSPIGISLTAGLDSRAAFAATLPHLDLDAFTWTYYDLQWNRPDVWADVIGANKLSASYGVLHRVIDLQPRADPEFEAAYERSMRGGAQFRALSASYAMNIPSNVTQLQSMLAEIATGFYKKRSPGNVTVERMARLFPAQDFSRSPEVVAAYEDYEDYSQMRSVANGPIAWQDLFYWENRAGRWSAVRIQECDLSHRLLAPYNSRHVIESMIGLDLEARVNKQILAKFVEDTLPTSDGPGAIARGLFARLRSR